MRKFNNHWFAYAVFHIFVFTIVIIIHDVYFCLQGIQIFCPLEHDISGDTVMHFIIITIVEKQEPKYFMAFEVLPKVQECKMKINDGTPVYLFHSRFRVLSDIYTVYSDLILVFP